MASPHKTNFIKNTASSLYQWDFEGKPFIAISLFIATATLPIAVFQTMTALWNMAIYSWATILYTLILTAIAYFTHKTRIPATLLVVGLSVGTSMCVIKLGSYYIISIFPPLLLSFYLLPALLAILVTGIPCLLLCYYFAPYNSAIELIALISTTVCIAASATAARFQINKFQTMASKDPLTGVGNRRAMSRKLDYILEQRDISKSACSLLIVDFDHFKAINDKFGHDIGDSILKDVMTRIQERLRETDSIFRFGGEEFVIVLEKASEEDAFEIAEELRKAIATAELVHGYRVTISIGVAGLERHETISEWIKRGDRALFQAKEQGRNRSVIAGKSNPQSIPIQAQI